MSAALGCVKYLKRRAQLRVGAGYLLPQRAQLSPGVIVDARVVQEERVSRRACSFASGAWVTIRTRSEAASARSMSCPAKHPTSPDTAACVWNGHRRALPVRDKVEQYAYQ